MLGNIAHKIDTQSHIELKNTTFIRREGVAETYRRHTVIKDWWIKKAQSPTCNVFVPVQALSDKKTGNSPTVFLRVESLIISIILNEWITWFCSTIVGS